MSKQQSPLFVGLISGTSMDGIDAALVEIDAGVPRLIEALAWPIEATLRADLFAAVEHPAVIDLDTLGQLDVRVGQAFGAAANALLEQTGRLAGDVAAIGSHGQTLRHGPDLPAPFTLQIGDPNVIAATTGITVVADFRRADMAAGGQGAPLAPALHAALLSRAGETRAVVNLGGIANVTLLTPAAAVLGFDTGPANALLDGWCERHSGAAFDRDGEWARSGRVHADLLDEFMAEPYLARPAPKSTGRELFNLSWLDARLAELGERLAPADVQATLLEFTARTVVAGLTLAGAAPDRVLLCGGGCGNSRLVERLRILAAPAPVETTADYGMHPDWVEAIAFAWLAERRLAGAPGNLPSVTGASRDALLGGIFAPPPHV